MSVQFNKEGFMAGVDESIKDNLINQLFKNSDIRLLAAKNPECPLFILERFIQDENSGVREALAQNSKCPTRFLEELVEDSSPAVRRAIAKNENCSLKLFTQLADDTDGFVRDGIAENPRCPLFLLDELSHDEAEGVRDSALRALHERGRVTQGEMVSALQKATDEAAEKNGKFEKHEYAKKEER